MPGRVLLAFSAPEFQGQSKEEVARPYLTRTDKVIFRKTVSTAGNSSGFCANYDLAFPLVK